ncbi:Autophagy protein 29 [Coccidioides immitis]|nr:Autophagy protein 29 [Coccidioides immitis]
MDPRFTVIVRLPFPRGDFVDPPPPDWTAAKDRVLWEVLLQPSKPVDCKIVTSSSNPGRVKRG